MADTFAGRWPGASRSSTSLRRNPSAAWRHIDVLLLLPTLVIATVGTLMVFSTTRGTGDTVNTAILERHVSFLAAGLSVMVLVTFVDYRRFRDWALPAFLGVCGMLMAVLSPLGAERQGAQAWFELGPFDLQPSELTKIALVAMLAALGANYAGDIDLRRLSLLMIVAIVPLGLILLQPDLGTALVLVAITMGVLLVAGVRAKHIAGLTLLGLTAVVGILNSGFLEEYQTDRLTVFLDPGSGLREEAYNLNQSKIAIGSGGLTGKGLFDGPQTQLGAVPEQETDFIFTAIGEELGFVGSALVLAMFALICWRIWRIAQLSRDLFGQLLCAGVLSILVFQLFQNAGMTMGIMPITGIPLPMVSHGGSSTIAVFAGLGIVHNVHMRRFT